MGKLEYIVPVQNPREGLFKIAIKIERNDGAFVLSVQLPWAPESIDVTANDYFDCLLDIRRKIEPLGWKICCKGASRNVWPSGMSRSMSDGLKAYVLQFGEKPSQNQLVSIFEAINHDDYCCVSDQEKFYEDWLKSIR